MSKAAQKKVALNPTFEQAMPKAQKKLEELILYVAKKCQNDPGYGAVKLNKILYFSDFYNYANNGKPITGVEYMKLGQGPVPKKLLPTRKQMEARGDIAIQHVSLSPEHKQQRVVALREPDLSVFTAAEIDTVHMIIESLKFKNARDVSELSHGRAWRIAKEHEPIPYESFWISDEDITNCDRDITSRLIKEGALCPVGAP